MVFAFSLVSQSCFAFVSVVCSFSWLVFVSFSVSPHIIKNFIKIVNSSVSSVVASICELGTLAARYSLWKYIRFQEIDKMLRLKMEDFLVRNLVKHISFTAHLIMNHRQIICQSSLVFYVITW